MQRAQCDAVMARAQRAREQWPDRTSAGFQREMGAVAAALEALAREADQTGANPLERARVWRFLGNAYFDLGDGHAHTWLQRAAIAFARSEALSLSLGDTVELVKLNYSYGHVLFHLASGGDASLLVQARSRYAQALEQARRVFPEGVADLEEALANADQALALLGQAGRMTGEIQRLQEELDRPADASAAGRAPDPLRAMMGTFWDSLRREFAEKRTSGEIAPDRAAALDDIMARLGPMVEQTQDRQPAAEGAGNRDAGASMDDEKRRLLDELKGVRDIRRTAEMLKARLIPMIQQPGRANAATADPHSRAGRLIARLEALKVGVGIAGSDTRRMQREHEVAIDLFARLARLTATLHEARADEARVLTLEREQARPLMLELRGYARRHQPALARPVWSHRSAPPDPNLVFFSGPTEVRMVLAAALAQRGLGLAHLSFPGADIARTRWEELRSSGLALFDLTGGDPAMYYELGMALVTGVEFVLTAQHGTAIPFDVGQVVAPYGSRGELESWLRDGLEAALYDMRSPEGQGSSVKATTQYAARLANAEAPHSLARFAARQLGEAEADPIEFRAALAAFNGYLSAEPHVVLYPRWPVSYPEPLSPRCFVVMPFREELEPVWHAVARECERAGVEPVRGDVAEGQQILGSIWTEIGRATHVVGDLTGLNPNVCLELGVAHAIGRHTLLIGRSGTERSLFPNLAKERCHPYPAGGRADAPLVAPLRQFLART